MMCAKTRFLGVGLSLVLSLLLVAACGDSDKNTPANGDDCGQGDELVVEGQTYCVYSRSITEEGFNCPSHVNVPQSYGNLLICSDGGGHPDALFDLLHERYEASELPTGPCVGVMCSRTQACDAGVCKDVQCWSDAECGNNETCTSGVCRSGPDAACAGLSCGDECIIYGDDSEPGGQGGTCDLNGHCVLESPFCNVHPECFYKSCGEECTIESSGETGYCDADSFECVAQAPVCEPDAAACQAAGCRAIYASSQVAYCEQDGALDIYAGCLCEDEICDDAMTCGQRQNGEVAVFNDSCMPSGWAPDCVEAEVCDDLNTCLEACGVGCPAPWYQACAEDGNRYCSDCQRECRGLALAEDTLICGEQYWEIAHYELPCIGEATQMCMYVKRDGAESFTLFYGSIDGFEYTWGRNYIVSLNVEEIPDPPADGSSLAYSLVEVIEATPVAAGTTFDLPFLVDVSDLITVDGATGMLGDVRAFRCEPESLCAEIEAFLTNEQPFRVHFKYDANIDDPLVVVDVEAFQP